MNRERGEGGKKGEMEERKEGERDETKTATERKK